MPKVIETRFAIRSETDVITLTLPKGAKILELFASNNMADNDPEVGIVYQYDENQGQGEKRRFRTIHSEGSEFFKWNRIFVYDEKREKYLGRIRCTLNGLGYPVDVIEVLQ